MHWETNPANESLSMHSEYGQSFEYTVAEYLQGAVPYSECIKNLCALRNALIRVALVSKALWCDKKQLNASFCSMAWTGGTTALHAGNCMSKKGSVVVKCFALGGWSSLEKNYITMFMIANDEKSCWHTALPIHLLICASLMPGGGRPSNMLR